MAQALSNTTETEVAVLQVQFKNLDGKVEELKDEMKDMRGSLERHSAEHTGMIRDMQEQAQEAHGELSKKISALEKWRWMLMGAGVVIGALGWPAIGKILGQ